MTAVLLCPGCQARRPADRTLLTCERCGAAGCMAHLRWTPDGIRCVHRAGCTVRVDLARPSDKPEPHDQ